MQDTGVHFKVRATVLNKQNHLKMFYAIEGFVFLYLLITEIIKDTERSCDINKKRLILCYSNMIHKIISIHICKIKPIYKMNKMKIMLEKPYRAS